jgi:phosphatidylinositol alpha-1,6-mannosyltransferase
MSRARVLVVTPDFPPAKGGIQILVQEVVRGLKEHEPTVIALDTDGAADHDRRQQMRVLRVQRHRRARALAMVGLNAAALSVARAERPDVVLSAHIVASPAAALLSRWLGIPYVQYVYAKEIGARRELARFAVTRARAVIAISHYARDLALAAGANPRRIRLIPPGVTLPGEVRREPGERPTILTIARLEDRYKGHDVMIRAMGLVRARVPDVQWVVVGDGPLRPALEGLARVNGVDDCVSFRGLVSDEERDALLRSADVFAMVSRLPAGGYAGEGFGIVYLEANAHGVPTVAGNVGGAVDAVDDGVTGVLVDPTDHLAVAGALIRLLTDRDYHARLAAAGPAWAHRFAWPLIAAQVEQVLFEVTGQARRAPSNQR